MNFTRQRWGQILLGLWFLFTGMIAILGLSFNGMEIVMAVFAIIVGILLLLG